VIASYTLTPIPGSKMAPWLVGGRSQGRETLLGLLPSRHTMAMAMDVRFDDAIVDLYRDIAQRFVSIPGLGLDEKATDRCLARLSDLVRNYTGRLAAAADFDSDGIAIVELVELEDPEGESDLLSLYLGPDGLIGDPNDLERFGIELERLTPLSFGAVRAERIRLRFAPSQAEATDVHLPGFPSLFDDMEIVTGVVDRYLVLVAAHDASARFKDIVRRIVAGDGALEDPELEAVLGPFPRHGEIHGYVDLIACL